MTDDEQPEAEGEDTSSQEVINLEDGGVVLPDGVYVYSIHGPAMIIFEETGQTELATVDTPQGSDDGDYGTFISQRGEWSSWEWVGNTYQDRFEEETPDFTHTNAAYAGDQTAEEPAAELAQPAAADRWAKWRTWPDHFDRLLDATQISSGLAIKALVKAESKAESVPFIATSNYAIIGPVTEPEVAEYFAPVAVRGTIRFTRNRTRPNVFTVEDVTAAYPDPDFPTWFTGTGDDRALARLVVILKWIVAQSNFYEHRDRDRIVIEGV